MTANYLSIIKELKSTDTKLVAVSKTKPISAIGALYGLGQRAFGENRVQELVEKQEQLPQDIEWHLIGHLQKNKVKYIAPFVSMIQSIDSFKLLQIVNKEASKNDRIIDVLLQIKIAKEESKFGFDILELKKQLDIAKYSNIRFCGVMGMATFTEDESQIRREFQKLVDAKNQLSESHFSLNPSFKEISMGMSGDYKLACELGSTMVRIGSLLFGNRN